MPLFERKDKQQKEQQYMGTITAIPKYKDMMKFLSDTIQSEFKLDEKVLPFFGVSYDGMAMDEKKICMLAPTPSDFKPPSEFEETPLDSLDKGIDGDGEAIVGFRKTIVHKKYVDGFAHAMKDVYNTRWQDIHVLIHREVAYPILLVADPWTFIIAPLIGAVRERMFSQVPWRDALVLEEKEDIIQFWNGDYEARITAVKQTWLGSQPTTVKRRKNGILVLTSRKLVWIEERGIFGKSYHPLATIPLENLKGISMGGAVLKYVSISDAQSEYIFHLSSPPIVNEIGLSSFKAIVFVQAKARKQELETEKKRERIHVLLDFSFLRSYMAKGGLTLQTFKCPDCGAPVKLPESGKQTECKHCGSTVYAQDIFEKVKALVG